MGTFTINVFSLISLVNRNLYNTIGILSAGTLGVTIDAMHDINHVGHMKCQNVVSRH